MENNLSIFRSACEHVDVVADIIQMLQKADGNVVKCKLDITFI